MTFEPLTISLPAHWLPVIINADPSGLDDKEYHALTRWENDMIRECGEFHIGEISDEAYFARYHDAAEYGVLACDCYDVTLLVQPAREVS